MVIRGFSMKKIIASILFMIISHSLFSAECPDYMKKLGECKVVNEKKGVYIISQKSSLDQEFIKRANKLFEEGLNEELDEDQKRLLDKMAYPPDYDNR